MDNSLNEIIKYNVNKLFTNKEYVTRAIYINIYTKIYNFCTKKVSFRSNIDEFKQKLFNERKEFYNNLVEILTNICKNLKKEIINSQNIIDKYNILFDNYSLCSNILDNMFEYFNRVFIRETDKYDFICIIDTCKFIWFKEILITLNNKFYHNILFIINNERKTNYLNNLYNIKIFLKSYQTLSINYDKDLYKEYNINFKDVNSIYKSLFEQRYLSDTKNYCISLNITQLSILEYIQNSNKIIELELELCEKNLFKITFEQIKMIFTKNLILDNHNYLENNLLDSLKSNNHNVSTQLYKFYEKYCDEILKEDEDNIIAISFSKFCKEYLDTKFKSIEYKETTFKEFMSLILDIYSFLKSIINDIFNNNNFVEKKFDAIFRAKFNTNSSIACENIAKYINFVMKQCNKDNIEIDEHDEFDKIISLLKYVKDKDYLEAFLMKCLSGRLLNKTNLDFEHILINKLKLLFGGEFINKMNSMMSDIHISKGLSDEYKTHESFDKGLEVSVITNFIWNMSKYKQVDYPDSLQTKINSFTNFYNRKFKGRKLEWNNNLISGEVVCHCFNKKYIFNASIYQLDILQNFNKLDSIKKENLDLDSPHLKSLIKFNILKEVDDNIVLNKDYKSKKIKQSISNYKMKTKENTHNKEKEKIDFDRNLVIQSAIVRIMKTRKTLQHNELISQTVSHIDKFSTQISAIKKNIETLIEKDYLERAEGNRNIYNYLA